jgi:hypothetical protein
LTVCRVFPKNTATKQALVVILDMPVVVHMLKPQRANLFDEFVKLELLPFMESQMSTSATRINAVWDQYPHYSLKSAVQHQRSQKKSLSQKGKNWQTFLKLSNKR